MINSVRSIGRKLSALGLLIRFSAISFSIILPLLGAVAGNSFLRDYQIIGLLGLAISFHIFAYVLNDVIDLPVDRTESLRADYPLVQGTVQPWQALTFALLQIPLAFVFIMLIKASFLAYIFLAIAFALMTIYDLWGKRTSFPLLTDLVQGLGWAALVLCGAASVSDHLGRPVGAACSFVIVFIMMVNGIHGSLRDLANDLECGTCTTAILLGVRPTGSKAFFIPFVFKLYALLLQIILSVVVLLPLAYNWSGYQPRTWNITITTVTALMLLSTLLLLLSGAWIENRSRMILTGTLHIIASLTAFLISFVALLNTQVLIAMLVAYTLPLCHIVWDWLTRAIQHVRHRHTAIRQAQLVDTPVQDVFP